MALSARGGATGERPQEPTYRASLSLPRDEARRTAALFSELLWPPADAVGLVEADSGPWRVDVYFSHPPDLDLLKKFLCEDCQLDDPPGIIVETLADTDWITASQHARPPVVAGRYIVHGAHDRAKVRRRRWAIEIEASQAFGTGHHGSTEGCLIALDRLLRHHPVSRALDIGAGTGVLAIALAKAGCHLVLANDSDRLAVAAAREAVRQNGVADRVQVLQAAGLQHVQIRHHAPFDLVVANILARPLAALSGGIARHTRPGSIVVLSGLLRAQASALAACYRAHGFALERRVTIGDWATLVLRRH
jgi:ribosomal protein L11 methyltransferase